MRLRILKLLLFLLILMGVQPAAGAQQPYAAVIEVLYPGVELKRANTADWLALPAGAQAPLGTGDSLRTNADGRALIHFADTVQTLVLTKTEYAVTRFEQDDAGGLIIDAQLIQGSSIHRILTADKLAAYQLTTEYITITRPTALFAAQVEPGVASAVIVGDGTAVVTAPDAEVTLRAGEGLRAAPALGEVIKLDAPYRFSFLSVTSDVCRGIVQATLPNMESVFVRVGPGEDYRGLGQIPNGTKIAILGVTESGKRYRTPYLSGFGWVINDGIITQNCSDLPLVAGTVESVNSIRSAQTIELEFLQPFFGLPEDDTWFYIYD